MSPKALARVLSDTFGAVARPYLFGIYIAGFDGAKPSLWHEDVPTSESGVQDRSEMNRVWPVSPPETKETLDAWLAEQNSSDPVSLGVGFVQEAHKLAPDVVNAETKRIRVTPNGAEWM